MGLKTTAQLREQIRRSKHKPIGRPESITIEIDGETRTLKQWAIDFGIPYPLAYNRYLKGRTGRDIFAEPRPYNKPR